MFPNPGTHLVILMGAIAFGLVSTSMTMIIMIERNWGPEELFEPQTICLLSPSYFKIVMETASLWGPVPYNTTDGTPCWYWHGLRKYRGYLVTGFKMDWSPINRDSTGVEMFDFLNAAPIEKVWIPESWYSTLQSKESSGGWAVQLTHYGGVKIHHANYGVVPEFALFANKIERSMTEKEVHCLKSVDAMAGGV